MSEQFPFAVKAMKAATRFMVADIKNIEKHIARINNGYRPLDPSIAFKTTATRTEPVAWQRIKEDGFVRSSNPEVFDTFTKTRAKWNKLREQYRFEFTSNWATPTYVHVKGFKSATKAMESQVKNNAMLIEPRNLGRYWSNNVLAITNDVAAKLELSAFKNEEPMFGESMCSRIDRLCQNMTANDRQPYSYIAGSDFKDGTPYAIIRGRKGVVGAADGDPVVVVAWESLFILLEVVKQVDGRLVCDADGLAVVNPVTLAPVAMAMPVRLPAMLAVWARWKAAGTERQLTYRR